MALPKVGLLRQARARLRQGGVIAYPTESCFGLGCDPRNVRALERVLAIKARPNHKGLIVIAADIAQLRGLICPLTEEQLAELARYWPGHYTFLLPASRRVAPALRGHHVAILVRARGIPALVAVGATVLDLAAGQEVLLDAGAGWLDIHPDQEALEQARHQMDLRSEMLARVRTEALNPARTRDGVLIDVAANIANERDAREAIRQGADGVGLLRSEFLFIDRTQAPTRGEQQTAYQAVLDALQGKCAIMRTLDVGGDKELPYLPMPQEPNPALGLRGIRSGFSRPELLDDQLAALLAVRPQGAVRILLPMVSDVSDLLRVRRRLEQLADEAGLKTLPKLGVMIEVPSAALLADQLSMYADFLSIGTNDLTQYTLAMDRCHPEFAAQLDPLHPAVLRLVAQSVAGATAHSRWVGVCGAMASDLDAIPVLLGLGVTELSVSPGLIPEIKARVRALDLEQCRREVQPLLQLSSAQQVRTRAREIWPQD